MNGVHDMGGMQDMGPIQHEKDEPVFLVAWEGRVHAMNSALAAWGRWNIDAARHELELLPPADYLRWSYYERWFERMLMQVVKYGFVTKTELESGKPAAGFIKATPALTPQVARSRNRNIPSAKDPSIAPGLRVLQHVRARNINPTGHTRLPRYARCKTGQIVKDHGVYTFPDTNAHFQGEKRQHLYSVRFTARELWGEAANSRDFVYLDLWEDYLEPA